MVADRVELGQRLRVEGEIQGRHVLLHSADFLGARDWDDRNVEPRALPAHPGQGHLRWAGAETVSHPTHRAGDGLVCPVKKPRPSGE